MALNFLNRCVWRAASSGTGDFVVASAITGYVVPEDALNPTVVDADTYTYFAQSDDLTQWEVGTGVYTTADDTLTRASILDSSNSGSIVTFSAAPSVYMGGPLAEQFPSGGGGGVTNPMTADLDVGGFEIVGASDGSGVLINGRDDGAGFAGRVQLVGGDGDSGGGISASAGNGSAGAGGDVDFNGGQGATNGGGMNFFSGNGEDGDGGTIFFYAGSGTNANGGTIYFNSGTGDVNGGDMYFTLPAAGSGRQGLAIFSGLPTSDPGVVGALWDDSGTLKISQ